MLRGPRALGQEYCGRIRAHGRPLHRHRRQPACLPGRRAGYQFLGESRALRALLRCVQRPDSHLRGCPRFPAGHGPGVRRHHPPRGETALCVCRGHRPQDHCDHAQGLWRRILRDGLQALAHGHQSGLADRRDRGHGPGRRGQHRLPPRTRRGRRPDRGAPAEGGRIPRTLRQPFHRRRARVRRRCHRAARDPPARDPRAAHAGEQGGHDAPQEAWQYTSMRWLACSLLLAAAASAQDRLAVDWRKLEPEILANFTTLLKIDTSNPPGHETQAAKAIQSILERDGIPCRLFALDPARANLVARIQGTGKKPPVLIMGHTDVVGLQREKWTVDPFGAVNRNGVIYARGARDDKPHVVAGMTILLLLKRMHVQLDRDVIFLAEAGEEGTSTYGIDYMVKEHWAEIAAEYAIAEGGSIVEENGKPHHVLISTTEKSPQRMRLVAHGPAGHGSRPEMANAVVHLAEAVARAGNWQTPMRLGETTRTYFC